MPYPVDWEVVGRVVSAALPVCCEGAVEKRCRNFEDAILDESFSVLVLHMHRLGTEAGLNPTQGEGTVG